MFDVQKENMTLSLGPIEYKTMQACAFFLKMQVIFILLEFMEQRERCFNQ